MTQTLDLASRVADLERNNRQLRRASAVMALALGAVIVAAQTPQQPVVRAERFEIVDSSGRTHAVLRAVTGSKGPVGSLMLTHPDGYTEVNANEIVVRSGMGSATVRPDVVGVTKGYLDKDMIWQTRTVVMRAAEEGASLQIRQGIGDPARQVVSIDSAVGRTRLILGVADLTDSGGSRIIRPPSSLILLDESGRTTGDVP